MKKNVADLRLDPKNARAHPTESIKALKSSLERFGQQKPIVITEDGEVVAGNGTLQAASELGWKKIDTLVTKLTGPELDAYKIADNRTAEMSEWNPEMLTGLLGSLNDDDKASLGFDAVAMRKLADQLAGKKITPKPIPELPTNPVAMVGDVYRLGDHLVACGDSLEIADLVLENTTATMCFTDPPYNVGYHGPVGSERARISGDSMAAKDWEVFSARVAAMIASRVDGCVYICHASGPEGRVFASALDRTMHCSSAIVWVKNRFVMGRSPYHHRHEPIWFGWPKRGGPSLTKERTNDGVWEFDRPSTSKHHPTQKPLGLVARAIEHASMPGDSVFDPFLGSGTTLIAAEQLGRRCLGVELEPCYVDVIIERWEEETGKQATKIASLSHTG